MESLNILHSRGEIISEYVGCIDRVLDKMVIKVTCVRGKYKSKVILSALKDSLKFYHAHHTNDHLACMFCGQFSG